MGPARVRGAELGRTTLRPMTQEPLGRRLAAGTTRVNSRFPGIRGIAAERNELAIRVRHQERERGMRIGSPRATEPPAADDADTVRRFQERYQRRGQEGGEPWTWGGWATG